MDAFTFSSFSEMVVHFFPRAIMLFVGIAVGIALFDTLKPTPPPFGRLAGKAFSRFSAPRR